MTKRDPTYHGELGQYVRSPAPDEGEIAEIRERYERHNAGGYMVYDHTDVAKLLLALASAHREIATQDETIRFLDTERNSLTEQRDTAHREHAATREYMQKVWEKTKLMLAERDAQLEAAHRERDEMRAVLDLLAVKAVPVKGSRKFETDAEIVAWGTGVNDALDQVAERAIPPTVTEETK